jgi:acetyl esterase/lipase
MNPLLSKLFWQNLMILLSWMLVSCEKPYLTTPFTPYINPANLKPALTLTDVAYGADPLQKLDIYLPAGRDNSQTRLIVLIHGGQWSSGDKSQMQYFINSLRHRLPEYAFASVNYRLAQNGNHVFPAQEEDVNRAINFLINMADSFSIARKFVLMGESAGGHLALLQAYKNYKTAIKVVIALHAPSDLTEMYINPYNPENRTVLETATGTTPFLNFSLYYQSSPANYINAGKPAGLLFHGTSDGFLNPQQSLNLKLLLQSNNILCSLVLLPNEQHGFTEAGLQRVFDETKAFLSQPLIFR